MSRDEIIIDYFMMHPESFIKDIAEATCISRSTIQRTLNKYLYRVLPNGNTIGDQLKINKIKGNLNGGIQSSLMTLSIKDEDGKFIGSIKVSSDFDRKIINEARYYLTHKNNMKEVAAHFNISIRTLQLHFKKLNSIDLDTYNLVREKQLLNQIEGRKVVSGGRKSNYTMEEINNICDIIINNSFSYNEASLYFDIPSSTLFELMKRVDEDRRNKLNLLAEANIRNTTTDQIVRNRLR